MSSDTVDNARLEALLKEKEPGALIEFFRNLSEAERRPFAALCKRALKESWNFDDRVFDSGQCGLAYLACGTLADLTAADSNVVFWDHDHAIAILKDRKPEWLTDYFAMRLEKRQTSSAVGHTWQLTRECMAAGLCAEPPCDAYVLGFIGGFYRNVENQLLLDRLLAMPDVFEKLIWRIFEVEGGGEVSLTNVDKYFSKKNLNWSDALLRLSEMQKLDRQRLLDASLDALNRGFGQYRAGWFSRFHEAMEPTLEERAARLDKYLDLLASPIGPTVSLAVTAIKKLQKAKRLSIDAVLGRIEPALYAKTASTVKAVLALLTDLGKSNRANGATIARLSAVALEHAEVAVQEAACEVIESYGDASDVALIQAIQSREQVASASVRGRLAAWLGANATSVAKAAATSKASTNDSSSEGLMDLAKDVPEPVRQLAGLDAALQCVSDPAQDLPALSFNTFDVPQLSASTKVEAIDTFDGFIEQALIALENPEDILRIELVIDAAVRFANHATRSSDPRVATLKKRLKQLTSRREWPWQAATPVGALQEVMLAFVEDKLPEYRLPPRDPRAVIVQRSAEAAAHIVEKRSCPLLSAPTHSGFWIDPRVLVERTRVSIDKKQEAGAGPADRILALLRMAPDHRAAALQAAKPLDSEWGLALRYALGDSVTPGGSSLWIAASRARNPYSTDNNLKSEGKTAGLNAPCEFDFFVDFDKPKHPYDTPIRNFRIEGSPPTFHLLMSAPRYLQRAERTAKPDGDCLPTVGMCGDEMELLDSYFDLRHYTSWAAALWPAYPEPIYALGAVSTSVEGDTYGTPSPNVPIADGLLLLLNPNLPVSKIALILLCRGLNTNHAAAGRASVDAAIAAINDGRLDGELLGAMMQRFRFAGIVVAKRWAPRLKEIAASSVYAALVIRRALERCFREGEARHESRDLHVWIELLHELSVECGASIDDSLARTGLEKAASGDKAKKLVKKLLALIAAEKYADFRAEAHRFAFARRLERAKAWNGE